MKKAPDVLSLLRALPHKVGHAYRTGDLVRLEHVDRFSYLGRLDNQLKIRGFRIEPSEVEAAINALEGVQVSAVVGRADNSEASSSSPLLLAYWMIKAIKRIRSNAAFAWCCRSIWFPQSWSLWISCRPRLAGKIDRKALLKVDIIIESSTQMPERSLTKTQEQVRALWETLFPGRHIALHDDFFAIGGHSLLATQLVFLLECKAFDCDIPLRLLFNHPTLSAMAESIDGYIASEKGPVDAVDRSFVQDGYERIHWQGEAFNPRADAAHRGDRIFGHLPAAFIAIGRTQSVLCMKSQDR